jgi:hypothetical protein
LLPVTDDDFTFTRFIPTEKPSIVLPTIEPDPLCTSMAVRASSADDDTNVLSVT